MKNKQWKTYLLSFMLISILLVPMSRVYAQSFERTPVSESIEQLTSLMDGTLAENPDAKAAWEDYLVLLNTAKYQDYMLENASETGSTYEEVSEIFSPDAEESMIEFTEYEIEYVYTYQTDSLDQLSIHLYFYNGGLYGTAFMSDTLDMSDEGLVSRDELSNIIGPGWPKMSVLKEVNPTFLGVLNMIKDEQLGSIIAFASGETLDDATLEFMSYEADMPTSSWYFTKETYAQIKDGTLMSISDQLVSYAVKDFIPSYSLRELVNRNTSDNIGYQIANEQMAVLLEQFVMRGLEDNVPGSTFDEVKSDFDVEAEMIELELDDPLTGLAYRFEDPNNRNKLGILTVYFFDNQFAYTSVESVDAGWNSASVQIDYTKGLSEGDIHIGETITYLTQTPMQVPAVGVMMRSNHPHQVAVIPVKDSENAVMFVDIYNYHIEGLEKIEIDEATGELSDDMFNYIFNQY